MNTESGDVTARIAVKRSDCIRAIQLIETTAYDTSREWGKYVLLFVISDEVPECSCDPIEFRRLVHKFYYLLSVRKGV